MFLATASTMLKRSDEQKEHDDLIASESCHRDSSSKPSSLLFGVKNDDNVVLPISAIAERIPQTTQATALSQLAYLVCAGLRLLGSCGTAQETVSQLTTTRSVPPTVDEHRNQLFMTADEGCAQAQVPTAALQSNSANDASKESSGLSSKDDIGSIVKSPQMVDDSTSTSRERDGCEGCLPADGACPTATESSIPMELTTLYALQTEDSLKEVLIIVPDGVREDRKVRVALNDQMFEVEVPPGVTPGDQVPVLLPSARPPLDAGMLRRIWHEVRWPLRWNKVVDSFGAESWQCDENRRLQRLAYYQAMRGSKMDPMLHSLAEESP
jgi:hypothetical protein